MKLRDMLFSLCCILLLFACNMNAHKYNEDIIGTPELTIPVKQNDTVNARSFQSMFKDLNVITLKTRDSSLFVAAINKVILFKNKYFILDKRFSNLACFDSSGNFLQKYGQIGLGPQEFRRITDFDIDSAGNRIAIFSNEDKAIYYYNIDDTRFIKKQKTGLYGSALALLPDKNILIYSNYSIFDKSHNNNVILIDSNANILKEFLPFDPDYSNITWTTTGFLTTSNTNILLANAFGDTVYTYKNQRLAPYVAMDVNSDNVNKSKYYHNALFKSQELLKPATSFLNSDFFKNDHYLVFTYQNNLRLKVGAYNIKNRTVTICAKSSKDPFTVLVANPLYLAQDNTMIFSLPIENIVEMKEKYADLFEKLPDNIKQALREDTQDRSFLLKAKIED